MVANNNERDPTAVLGDRACGEPIERCDCDDCVRIGDVIPTGVLQVFIFQSSFFKDKNSTKNQLHTNESAVELLDEWFCLQQQ